MMDLRSGTSRRERDDEMNGSTMTLRDAKRLAKRRLPQDMELLKAHATLQKQRRDAVQERDAGYAVQARARASVSLSREEVVAQVKYGQDVVDAAHRRLRSLPTGSRALRRACERGAVRRPR
jgi:hypothetical protein